MAVFKKLTKRVKVMTGQVVESDEVINIKYKILKEKDKKKQNKYKLKLEKLKQENNTVAES